MRILHTSDWHLGRTLCGRKRYAEFEAFLDWLADTLAARDVDVLLVAGDVFDTTTPSNRSQQLYYQFLCRVAAWGCHVVVVGGNHDSPTFLDAPKELLGALNVHVVGAATENPEDELVLLRDGRGELECIVCAVPYLRDRDVRVLDLDESIEDKERKRIEGVARHYHAIAAAAEKKRTASGKEVPILALGHLFVAGGQTADGDGVRDLYVGSLARVGTDCFPAVFDYLALGHLHLPQSCGGSEARRYSGSPLLMGFGEAEQGKSVALVDIAPQLRIEEIPVPVFQRLSRLSGDLETIGSRLMELREGESEGLWLEVVYTGKERVPNLRDRLEALLEGTRVEILRIKNEQVFDAAIQTCAAGEMLDEADPVDIFLRCMEARSVPEGERPGLLTTYREVLNRLDSEDTRAE